MQPIEVVPVVIAGLILCLFARVVYVSYLLNKARDKAWFAMQYGVWSGPNDFGLQLMLQYYHSLKFNMDYVLNHRAWSIPRLIEDKWVPLYEHCNNLKPVLASNEQLIHIMGKLQEAETTLKLAKQCVLDVNKGYEMRVTENMFQQTVFETVKGIESGEKCIIDIFSKNNIHWKAQPKQPENRQIIPNQTLN